MPLESAGNVLDLAYGRLPDLARPQGCPRRRERPMTLGNAAAARVRLICGAEFADTKSRPTPVEMAERHGADTAVLAWRAPRLLPVR
jgi:hypothetical protein